MNDPDIKLDFFALKNGDYYLRENHIYKKYESKQVISSVRSEIYQYIENRQDEIEQSLRNFVNKRNVRYDDKEKRHVKNYVGFKDWPDIHNYSPINKVIESVAFQNGKTKILNKTSIAQSDGDVFNTKTFTIEKMDENEVYVFEDKATIDRELWEEYETETDLKPLDLFRRHCPVYFELTQVLVEREDYNDLHESISTKFLPYRTEKKIDMWQGRADSGKSSLVKFVVSELMGSEHFHRIETNEKTRDKYSNYPLQDKRWLDMPEPKGAFDFDYVNQIIGGDQLPMRAMRSVSYMEEVWGGITLHYNKPPLIYNLNNGKLRKLRVTRFTNKFDNAELENPYDRIGDEEENRILTCYYLVARNYRKFAWHKKVAKESDFDKILEFMKTLEPSDYAVKTLLQDLNSYNKQNEYDWVKRERFEGWLKNNGFELEKGQSGNAIYIDVTIEHIEAWREL